MYYTDSSARLLDDIKCMAKLKAEHSKNFLSAGKMVLLLSKRDLTGKELLA